MPVSPGPPSRTAASSSPSTLATPPISNPDSGGAFRVLLDEIVFTDYGQFDLARGEPGVFDGDADRVFAGQVNGLVGAADPSGVYLHLARRSGGSPLRVVLNETEPPLDDRWEDVVEVSIAAPPGARVAWSTWAGDTSGPLDAVRPGTYRLRVSAEGRDAGSAGEFAPAPVDAYLIELWPSPHAPDAIVRVSSDDAAYWHREWGSRRPIL